MKDKLLNKTRMSRLKICSILFLLIIFMSFSTVAVKYNQNYNNYLTRSIADYIYCMQYGSCSLNSLIVQNLTVTSYFNASVVSYNVTGDIHATGNFYSNGKAAMINDTQANYYGLFKNTNTTNNITITDEGFFKGQPIDGMLGSGIIYINQSNDFAEVNVTCVGLVCSYNAFTVRLVKTDLTTKYCNKSAGSYTMTDNQHSILYVDNNCAVQEISIQNYVKQSVSPGGISDFANIIGYNSQVENANGLGLEGKRIIKLRKLLLKCDPRHLSICNGFARTVEKFPNFTIQTGEYVYLFDVVQGSQVNITKDGLEMVSHETANTWRHKDSTTGINLTWCDTGTATALCTNTNLYRRHFFYYIGYNDSVDTTELHQNLPLQSTTYSTLAQCLDIETNPITLLLPSYYEYAKVLMYAYCGRASDSGWTGGWIDLRTVKSTSATGGIDLSIYVPYTGASANVNIDGYNFTTYDTIIAERANISNITARNLNITLKANIENATINRLNVTNQSLFNAPMYLNYNGTYPYVSGTNFQIFRDGINDVSSVGLDVRVGNNASVSGAYQSRGIAGYTITRGDQWGAGSKIYGLDFLVYADFGGGSVGNSNLDAYGINTGILTVTTSTQTYRDAYGIRTGINPFIVAGTVNYNNWYGAYLANPLATGTQDANHLLIVEKPTTATYNYQVSLMGNGTGTGIWFNTNGTSNPKFTSRIYAPQNSSLQMDIEYKGNTRWMVNISNETVVIRNATIRERLYTPDLIVTNISAVTSTANITINNNLTSTNWGTCNCIAVLNLMMCSNQSSDPTRKADGYSAIVSNISYQQSLGLCK